MTQTQHPLINPGDGERAALPLQLEFLRVMGAGEAGPFGPRYTIVVGWRLLGTLDESALAGALYDVVARHEALRTEIVLGEAEAAQVICRPGSPDLSVRELGEAPAR